MSSKERVSALLATLPEDCSIEDVQYHLYVMEKVRRGVERAEIEGTISQDDVEARLTQWADQ